MRHLPLILCKKKKKTDSKWIKDLNVSPETLKLLEEHYRQNCSRHGTGKEFLKRPLTAKEVIARIDN